MLRLGRPAKGRLLALAPVQVYGCGLPFFKSRFEATYVYTDSSGKDLYGQCLTTDLSLLNEKRKGDELDILILPENERKSVLLDIPALMKFG